MFLSFNTRASRVRAVSAAVKHPVRRLVNNGWDFGRVSGRWAGRTGGTPTGRPCHRSRCC